ncbi:MAG: YraN family protein [Gammaproteobacteria bacterium]|nr:YraN family protein [Gammaproteobacteria bacterium]MDP2140194.1 YraN family protein [Gammaproteobacteria bacterium]MDP2348070.1 YraN family protein [Gammaproteobacteria bacterium]
MKPHTTSIAVEPSRRRAFGEVQEKAAAQYLIAQGLELISANYQCKLGEIDLIMRDTTCLVFVEVRFRRSLAYGTPAESVDYRKQRKLMRTAQSYLKSLQLTNRAPCRFDVLGISPGQKSGSFHFDWIQSAFEMA